MKKFFTLVSIAFCAMSVNAQEVWKAAEFNLESATIETLTNGIYGAGTADAPDTNVPGELKTSTIHVNTGAITLTALSTPNGDKNIETGAEAWQLKGSVDGNDALIVEGCTPKFAQYIMGQGNPELNHWEFDEETENGTAHRVYGTFWEPGNEMPAKGSYWKFETTTSGTLKTAIFGNKNANPTYIVDASTKQPLAPANVDIAIFYQNTGFAYEGNAEEGTAKYLNVGKMADDYVLQHTNGVTQNRPVLGYISFPVEAGKTYYLFNPKSQIGLYGYEFTAGGASISDITATDDANAPVYNLAGQRVSKDTKGLLIKNGKKFINK